MRRAVSNAIAILAQISRRQREVLHQLAESRTMQQAANELQVKARTIAFHKYQIMREHGIKTNADLIHYAIQNQLVD